MTPFLTYQQISELSDERLLGIIKTGNELNWNILYQGEKQDDLDEYITNLFNEKERRKL